MTLSPQGWVYEKVLEEPRLDHLGGSRTYIDVRFWRSLQRFRDGEGDVLIEDGPQEGRTRCDLASDFIMMLREDFQRIVVSGPLDARLLHHVSGALIPEAGAGSDPRVYTYVTEDRRIVKDGNGNWRRTDGGVVVPYRYPDYWGRSEALDGQWLRETGKRDLPAVVTGNIERFITLAKARGWSRDMRGTTENLTVGAGADDAFELDDGSGFTGAGTVVELHSSTAAGSRRIGGMRFVPASLGQGDTISSALWSGWIFTTVFDDVNIDAGFENVDASANFTDTADVKDRWDNNVTSATISKVQNAVGTGYYQLPELDTELQEVVDRVGYAGGAVTVLIHGKADASKSWMVRSEENSGADEALLDIVFTAGAPPGLSIPIAMHYYRQRRN